jgi:PKD repeat protein
MLTILDAENNWWGDSSGPQAPSNPGGTGDPISGNVDYTPWLLHPYGPPFAAFNYTIVDKTVTFDAAASGDYDGTITAYQWDFGDSMTGSGKNVSHTYDAYQTYTVSLTVTDNDGFTNTTSRTITLGDSEPPIIWIRQPQSGYLYFNLWDIISGKIHFFMTIVFGEITVIAEAYDNQSGMDRVEFWVDSVLKFTDYMWPYEWLWSEKGVFQYTLKAIAYDKAGNSAQDSVTLWKVQLK